MMTSSLHMGQYSEPRDACIITHFLNFTSATRSRPPLILSARKTLPVVAIATIWECSLNGLNEMGSWISPEGLRE